MKTCKKLCLILVLFISNFSSLMAQDWTLNHKVLASDKATGDDFGRSVAISDEFAVVGAPSEDHDENGGNKVLEAGSAYIFKNTNGTWAFDQKIVHNDREMNDVFGSSIAIQDDIIIVGSEGKFEDLGDGNTMYSAGAVYIFKNNSATWEQIQKLYASDREASDYFGSTLSISGDYLIIGAARKAVNGKDDSGTVYIFKHTDGSWTEVQKITAPDSEENDQFGRSVSIFGDYAFVGSYSGYDDVDGNNFLSLAGAVYVYHNTGENWEFTQKLTHSDRNESDNFGTSVAISGNYATIGSTWQEYDVDGNNFLEKAGAAYIFKNTGGTWSEVQKIVASDRQENDDFGLNVAMYNNNLLVGVPYKDENGASYLFKNREGNWTQEQKLEALDGASSDYFGSAVAIHNNSCIIGAHGKIANGNTNVGAAYIFSDGTVSTALEYLDLPALWSLSQNYPNPFNSSTTISYQIPSNCHVKLTIYDSQGREIKTLVNQAQNAGNYSVDFDGSMLPEGVYFYHLNSEGIVIVNMMLLIK